MTENKPMSRRQLAEYLGVSQSTVDRMRSEGTGPPSFKIGGSVKYLPKDVDEWFDSLKKQKQSGGSNGTDV